MATFQLNITTPDGHIMDQEVVSLVAPGQEGSLGIMAHHAPMLCALKPGVLTVRTPDAVEVYALGEGLLEASDNQVRILADGAEPATSPEDARERLQAFISPWHA